MAKKTPTHTESVASLTPNSINVQLDGKDVRVAMSKEENALLNLFLASEIRSFIQDQLRRYKTEDRLLTPRELRDIAGSVKDISEASNAMFDGPSLLDGLKTKPKSPTKASDISFDIPNEPTANPDRSPNDTTGQEGQASSA